MALGLDVRSRSLPDRNSIAERGFSLHENVLTQHECDEIIFEIQRDPLRRPRAGVRHLLSNPKVCSIASDQRLLALACPILGPKAVPFRATLFEKCGKANWLVVWHQDTALPLRDYFQSHEWGPWSTKEGRKYAHAPSSALRKILALRIHLDDSTTENGPLRVLPGSHQSGVLGDEQIFSLSRSLNHKECLISKGGVLAMSPLLIHSSSKVTCHKPRRVLHIEYASSLQLDRGIHLDLC